MYLRRPRPPTAISRAFFSEKMQTPVLHQTYRARIKLQIKKENRVCIETQTSARIKEDPFKFYPKITEILAQEVVVNKEPRIKRAEMLDENLVAAFDITNDPVCVNIAKQLFVEAQFSSNKLTSLTSCGKSYLFNDERAGVIVADRGLPGGSKYRHLITEHDRLRRVRLAQEQLLDKESKLRQ